MAYTGYRPDPWNKDSKYDREALFKEASALGKELATAQYPHLIQRNVADIVARARGIADKTIKDAWKEYYYFVFESGREAYIGEFIQGYTKGYFDTVAELDKKEGRSSAVQPATSPTGVSVSLLKVERSGNEFVYTIRIDDPSLQYPIIRELEFDTTSLKTWKGAYGIAFGDAIGGS